jgi:hypothetical protein
LKQKIATADSVSAQKDSVMAELALSTRLLSDVSAELAKVQVQGRGLRVSHESPGEASRDTIRQKIRYVVARLSDNESRLRDSRKRIEGLTHLSDSLRATLDSTLANLASTIESQKTTIAQLTEQVGGLQNENLALKDTLNRVSAIENTVYYIVAPKDELLQKGIIVEEGGSRFLFVLWKTGKTLQPARTLDPSMFTAIDKRQTTEIPLSDPSATYHIASRQSFDYLATEPDDHGNITGTSRLRISAPEQFWRQSKFLIIVREGGRQPPTSVGRSE